MKLEIEGDIVEIGNIQPRTVQGPGAIVNSREGVFFIPATMPDVQAVSQAGYLYKRVRITITLEEM